MVKNLKGGIRQRLGFTTRKAAKAKPVRSDPLGQQLLKIYTKGKVGSGDVGATAKALVDATGSSSSSGHTALTRLARAAPIRMRVSKAIWEGPP